MTNAVMTVGAADTRLVGAADGRAGGPAAEAQQVVARGAARSKRPRRPGRLKLARGLGRAAALTRYLARCGVVLVLSLEGYELS